MRFLVVWRLFLLVGVGALAGTWLAVATQRRRQVVRFTAVELLDVVAPNPPRWRRHVPAVLFLVALAVLVLGFARPVRALRVTDERATVILAVDVSRSMEATDVEPTRLAVAQAAARDFVADLPDDLDVGLVTFHGVAGLAVPPSRDRDALLGAIDRLDLGEGTAIGDAVVAGLDAVERTPRGEDGEPVPARIVVMSDGETTTGISTEEAAERAAAAGVPVDTIAFGTPEGTIADTVEGTVPVPVAPGPLADLAAATGGDAYEAGSLDELGDAYAGIRGVAGSEEVERDVSAWFVGAGIGLLAVAGGLSLLWSQRLP
jgi:Ca-activated chloride channel family protein